jgi:hypothetical protein
MLKSNSPVTPVATDTFRLGRLDVTSRVALHDAVHVLRVHHALRRGGVYAAVRFRRGERGVDGRDASVRRRHASFACTQNTTSIELPIRKYK